MDRKARSLALLKNLLASLFLVLAAGQATAFAAPPRAVEDDGTWSPITMYGPVPRRGHCAVFDPVGNRMIIFGGEYFSDTWALNLSGAPYWSSLDPAHKPSARRLSVMVYDSARQRIVLVGGDDGGMRNDVWVLNLTGTPDWTQIVPEGVPPAGRMAAVGIYDPVRDRVVMFGGYSPDGLLGDVWELRFSSGTPTWAPIYPQGAAPSPRYACVGAYDVAGDRLLVTTGATALGYSNETWALPLGGTPQWVPLATTGTTPNPCILATGAYEVARQRLLLFGGFDGASTTNTVWELALAANAWRALSPTGTAPSARWNGTAVMDDTNSRMLIFGGFNGAFLNDTYVLQMPVLTGPPLITSFTPQGGRVGDPVTIVGERLYNATQIQFNGVPAAPLEQQYSFIRAQVPVGASTGPIAVTNPAGTATSAQAFFVGETPVISALVPDSGKVGAVVRIEGLHFAGAIRVTFGGTDSASFTVASDSLVLATVDSLASTGPVSVTTPAATGTSAGPFTVLPLDPRPRITAVRDIPHDQGGRVVVAWDASDFDSPARKVITGYRVWRRAPAAANGSLGAGRRPEPARVLGLPGYWEAVAEIPAAFLDGYAYTAGTPQDSIAGSNPYTAFFVQALTADPFTFFSSDPDSGYSVDNLAPPQPAPFVAVYSSSRVELHWGASRAADFAQFLLYRSSSRDFVPGPSNLVLATRDTGYVDLSPGASSDAYELVAVDAHGNTSRAARVAPDQPVSTLASLLSVDASADRIRLVWFAGGSSGFLATVYRRTETTDWTAVGSLVSDRGGLLQFEDRDVVAGTRYGYRLGLLDGDQQTFSDETWVVARAPRLSLVGVWPNPSPNGRFSVSFDLPTSEPARLEVWDIAGRRVDSRAVGSLGRGRHVAEFGAGARLAPGVYLVRLSHPAGDRTTRVVVLD